MPSNNKRPRSNAENICKEVKEFVEAVDWDQDGLEILKAHADQLATIAKKAANESQGYVKDGGDGNDDDGNAAELAIRVSLSTLSDGVRAFQESKEKSEILQERIRELQKEADAKKDVEAELADTKKQLNDIDEQRKRERFLMSLGDFWNGIHCACKYYDWEIQKDFEKHVVIPQFENRGLKVKDAVKSARFDSLKGNRVDEVLPRIRTEWQAIRVWTGDEASLPQTPLIDRLEDICEQAGISRKEYLQFMNKYSERNEMAHYAVPDVLPFITNAKPALCDWDGFDRALENHQKLLIAEFRAQAMPQWMIDEIKNTVGKYRRMFINQDPSAQSSSWLVTGYGKHCAEDIWEDKEKQKGKVRNEIPPRSIYKRAKFHDLDTDAMDRL